MVNETHPYVQADIVSVSELRQWSYCPRVVWYGRSMGDYRPTSGAMKAGIDAEAERQRLETRRGFSQYGITAVDKRFQFSVRSDSLGLAGRIDCLIETTDVTFEEAQAGLRPNEWNWDDPLFVPVEYKTTFRVQQKHNVMQLAAYARMLESLTGTAVPFGFIVMLPEEEVLKIEISSEIKRSLDFLIEEVQRGLVSDELPRPTPHSGKCQNCEFRRFCNDVW